MILTINKYVDNVYNIESWKIMQSSKLKRKCKKNVRKRTFELR